MLSHEDLRKEIDEELSLKFPCPEGEGYWPWVIQSYDDFFIARAYVDGEFGLYRFEYTVDGDEVIISPDPKAVEERFLYKGTVELAASGDVVEASSANGKKMLATLKSQNPLLASLDNSPNAHLVLFDLTMAGQESRHQGPYHYKLAASGLDAAMPSLITKPIHVTADYDAHFEDGEDPKVVGVFLGSMKVKNDDGTETLRALGTIFESDFPDVLEYIKANKKKLGASYEVVYAASNAKKVRADLIEISEYEFTGGAILHKAAAAHPSTQVLVADTVKTPRASIPGGKLMKTKKDALAGIPAEYHGPVNALIASAVAEIGDRTEVAELQATLATTQSEIVKLNESAAASAKTIAELTAARDTAVKATATLQEKHAALETAHATLTVEKDTVAATLATLKAEADAKDLAVKVEAQWTKIQADYGHPDSAKEELLPLVAKLVAAKEPITPEEGQKLFAAGKATNPDRKKVPLHAGAGNPGEIDKAALARDWPVAFRTPSVR